jgi:3-isopropylmalate/(R)-2-methylmalate dehydratase small subunit
VAELDPFTTVSGVAAPLPAANVDTDVIMPKRYLKGIDRSGLKEGLFHDLRFDVAGQPRPDFILNRPGFTESRFLVVGPNFGCGSSREHAVWGLRQLGVRALIGTSFAGIFFDNCARNGLLAISLEPERAAALSALVADPSRSRIEVDLVAQTITSQEGPIGFDIDALLKARLVDGLDGIGVTLKDSDAIRDFEAEYLAERPWLRADAQVRGRVPQDVTS